jgi:F0F1-type ATP synthase assembly protein I
MGIRDSVPNSYIEKEKENEEEEEEDVQKELIKNESQRHNSMILDHKRSLFHKIFGPMEAGSIRGSIFNMVILSLGTGMFALPKYMSNTSLFLACFLIIGICFAVWWSLLLLSKACEKIKFIIIRS